MGNSSSRNARAKARNPLPKIFKVASTLVSPKSSRCSKREEHRIWVDTAPSERAYRHHRKRLARIVADQWMHVARYRLITLKIRKKRGKNILRLYITKWKDVIEDRARMSTIFERVSVSHRFLTEKTSFYKWKQVVYHNRVLAEALRRAAHIVRCRQQLMVLTAFQRHSQAKILRREHFVKAERFHRLHVLKMRLSQWLSHVQVRLFKLELKAKACTKWRNYLLKSVLSEWKKAMLVVEVSEIEKSTTKDPTPQAKVTEVDQIRSPVPEDPILQIQILTKCFWCWNLLVSQKKAVEEQMGRQRGDGYLILVVRHYDRNLQRTAYEGWKKFALQSRLARSISGQSQELDALSNIGHHSEILQYHNTSRRVRGTEQNKNARAFSESHKQKDCSTTSRKDWTITQNLYAAARRELLEQMYYSTGSRKVWTIGLNDHVKAKREILKLMYCSKPSSREVAVSWFVKSLAKRFLSMWKEHVLILKRHRQNHWCAVVHSKLQCLLKGLHALRENVDAQQSKHELNELSVNCYHQNLKRKTVSGCKFLHQTKRAKLVQIEHATAQWRIAKLQDRFERWYLAIALKSMRREQQQKSIRFWNKQLLRHAFQAWLDVKGLLKEKVNLKMAQLSRLRGSLGQRKKSRIWRSWMSLRKEMNIKRFNEARALQFFIGFRAAQVVKALYIRVQEQKLKRSLFAKVAHIEKIRLLKLGIRTWIEYVLSKNLYELAANHRRRTLLSHAMRSLIQWHQPHVEFQEVEEDHGLLESLGISRRPSPWDTQSARKSAPVMPARAQPRRPTILYEDVAQTQAPKAQVGNAEDYSPSKGWAPGDPNLVAKEIEWMEQVLLDYEVLKMHIVRLHAELTLQLEQRSPDVKDGFDQQEDNKRDKQQASTIMLLQQEISSLENKKMVQRPLIHAVLSRIQDLQARKIPDA